MARRRTNIRRKVNIRNRYNVKSSGFSRMNTGQIIKYLIWGAVAILLIFVIKKVAVSFCKLFSKIIGEENADLEQKEQNDYINNAQDEIKPEKLTYSKSTYDSFAEGIWSALQSNFTEDEQSVYDVLKKIKTDADLAQLKVSYGQRPIGLIGFRVPMNLSQSIRSLFNSTEIQYCNWQLYKNGVKGRI
jgi:hypothetical protein